MIFQRVGALGDFTMDRNAELRATVKRLESNVRRKIRRNERKGIENVATFSPIRPSMDSGSFNKRQLTVYQHQLQRFQSRRNQFLADANSEAIPSRVWKAYKQKERKYNSKVNSMFAEAQDLVLPNGQTIRERMAIATPDHPSMANQAINALYHPTVRNVGSINGLKALNKLDKMMADRNTDEYFDYRRQSDKQALYEMVDMIGDEELRWRIDQLTDKQFDTLWNYTEFLTDILLNYDSAKKALEDKNYKKSDADEAFDNARMEAAYDHLDWIETNV